MQASISGNFLDAGRSGGTSVSGLDPALSTTATAGSVGDGEGETPALPAGAQAVAWIPDKSPCQLANGTLDARDQIWVRYMALLDLRMDCMSEDEGIMNISISGSFSVSALSTSIPITIRLELQCHTCSVEKLPRPLLHEGHSMS